MRQERSRQIPPGWHDDPDLEEKEGGRGSGYSNAKNALLHVGRQTDSSRVLMTWQKWTTAGVAYKFKEEATTAAAQLMNLVWDGWMEGGMDGWRPTLLEK